MVNLRLIIGVAFAAAAHGAMAEGAQSVATENVATEVQELQGSAERAASLETSAAHLTNDEKSVTTMQPVLKNTATSGDAGDGGVAGAQPLLRNNALAGSEVNPTKRVAQVKRVAAPAGVGCSALDPMSEIIPSEGMTIISQAPTWVGKVKTQYTSTAPWATMSDSAGELYLEVKPNEADVKRVAVVSVVAANFECTLHITQDAPAAEAAEREKKATNLKNRFIFGYPLDCGPDSECAKKHWGV